ncbi:MAG: RpiB/LacA/LacB family sugar-phosphate isomerase [Candidatus Saccharimonadales bacterium]
MKIALSTDHAGFESLQKLQAFLEARGHECRNFGPERYVPEDDYPDYIKPAAQSVASGECQFGIIFGGSGEGEAMAANRVKGVRCGVYYGPAVAIGVIDADGHTATDEYEILRLNRQHNDANMLSLAGRFLTPEALEQAVLVWLDTPFSGLERHIRRINKLNS